MMIMRGWMNSIFIKIWENLKENIIMIVNKYNSWMKTNRLVI